MQPPLSSSGNPEGEQGSANHLLSHSTLFPHRGANVCVRVSSWDSPGWRTLGLGPPRLSPSQPRVVPEARSSGVRRDGEVLVGPCEARLPERYYKILDGHTGRAPPFMTSTRDLQSPRHDCPPAAPGYFRALVFGSYIAFNHSSGTGVSLVAQRSLQRFQRLVRRRSSVIWPLAVGPIKTQN